MRTNNFDMTGGVSGDLSGNIINLKPLWLGHIVNYAVQLVFTGSPVGVFTLQGSNDPGKEDKTNGGWDTSALTNWSDLSTQSISAAGNHMWNVENCGYLWVRVIYTSTSGSGSLTVCRSNAKGI